MTYLTFLTPGWDAYKKKLQEKKYYQIFPNNKKNYTIKHTKQQKKNWAIECWISLLKFRDRHFEINVVYRIEIRRIQQTINIPSRLMLSQSPVEIQINKNS